MKNCKSPISPGAYRFVISDDLAGLRLDQFLSDAGDLLTRGQARALIDLGGVHYAGRRTRRCSLVVAAGQQVEVFVDGQPLKSMPLVEDHILYRDDDIIVINKPAGMSTQPTPSRYQGTLYAELLKLLKNPRRKDLRPSIGMVQRLDRDTSGVLVFSIHKRAHKKLTEQFRNHKICKRYWALVSGHPEPDSGKFVSHLARRRSTNLMVSVEKGGKYAETRYHTLESMANSCLVEVELITGRSHQIRVHFSEAGSPLLGDKAYGGPTRINDLDFSRQMLHSRSLSFVHPVTDRKMTFEAPAPEDFRKAQESLERGLNAR